VSETPVQINLDIEIEIEIDLMYLRINIIRNLTPEELINSLIFKNANYKDTHRNKPENYFLGATRYQECLVNSLWIAQVAVFERIKQVI
jgi:hypothetical protein